jgi:dihydrofolate synthase / folylpolyglutamate synthase
MTSNHDSLEFDPVEYLFSLQHSGIKLGIERIKVLVEKLGHPEKQFRSIHIAGTNGKGSCSAMFSSIYQKQGYKVGLYTSPHLEVFNERIQINGKQISNKELLDLVIEIRLSLNLQLQLLFCILQGKKLTSLLLKLV